MPVRLYPNCSYCKEFQVEIEPFGRWVGGKFHQWFCKWKASPISSIVGWLQLTLKHFYLKDHQKENLGWI